LAEEKDFFKYFGFFHTLVNIEPKIPPIYVNENTNIHIQ